MPSVYTFLDMIRDIFLPLPYNFSNIPTKTLVNIVREAPVESVKYASAANEIMRRHRIFRAGRDSVLSARDAAEASSGDIIDDRNIDIDPLSRTSMGDLGVEAPITPYVKFNEPTTEAAAREAVSISLDDVITSDMVGKLAIVDMRGKSPKSGEQAVVFPISNQMVGRKPLDQLNSILDPSARDRISISDKTRERVLKVVEQLGLRSHPLQERHKESAQNDESDQDD